MSELRSTKLKGLSGTSTSGSVTLTLANTWYQVPDTVPTKDYVLYATIEQGIGDVRFSFNGTGTPSSANGNLAPGEISINLAGGQVVYYASSSAGDIINWTTKEI